MRYNVDRVLNALFFIISVVILVLWAVYFLIARNYPGYSGYYLAGTVFISAILLAVFIWLEKNWYKKVITKMAGRGQIALANIIEANKVKFLRDSTLSKYWLYEFRVKLYDREHRMFEQTFSEKLRFDIDHVPCGSIYITYGDSKDKQTFIIPNILISYIPELRSIVSGYENDAAIDIKYLNVFYNKGMVLKTYAETFEHDA